MSMNLLYILILITLAGVAGALQISAGLDDMIFFSKSWYGLTQLFAGKFSRGSGSGAPARVISIRI